MHNLDLFFTNAEFSHSAFFVLKKKSHYRNKKDERREIFMSYSSKKKGMALLRIVQALYQQKKISTVEKNQYVTLISSEMENTGNFSEIQKLLNKHMSILA